MRIKALRNIRTYLYMEYITYITPNYNKEKYLED